MVAEGGRQGWVKRITGPNAKILFSILFVLWALVFGVGLQLVPHEGASSPYGGLGLIALFSGLLHHDGPHLERDRRLAPAPPGAAIPRSIAQPRPPVRPYRWTPSRPLGMIPLHSQ